MADTIKVGSRLMTNLRLRLDDGSEHVLLGTSHPASDGMAVTENVPAEGFRKWMTEHATFDPVSSGMIFEVPEDHDTAPVAKEYGFQPALDRLLDDGDQAKLMEEGVPEEEIEALTNPRAGLVVPLPDPIPAPPVEEVHETPAPSVAPPVPSAEKPQVITATPEGTFRPAPASDSPSQDNTLNPDGGTSSNQTGRPGSAAPAPASPTAAAPAPAPTPAPAPPTPPTTAQTVPKA